jgi:hypothetical protein
MSFRIGSVYGEWCNREVEKPVRRTGEFKGHTVVYESTETKRCDGYISKKSEEAQYCACYSGSHCHFCATAVAYCTKCGWSAGGSNEPAG